MKGQETSYQRSVRLRKAEGKRVRAVLAGIERRITNLMDQCRAELGSQWQQNHPTVLDSKAMMSLSTARHSVAQARTNCR